MARKRKESIRTKLFIALGVLAAAQVGLYLFISSQGDGSESPQKIIERAAANSNATSPERKDLLKVQIALSMYMTKNQGKPPASLSSLVPEFLPRIPLGPDNKPIPYRVEGKKYYIAESALSTEENKKLGGVKGGERPSSDGSPLSEDERDSLLRVLTQDQEERLTHFDPTGKRDPFKPQNIAPDNSSGAGRTPLESYELEKLSYSAFLQTDGVPKAIVENSEGKGFTIVKGTKIGTRNGIVTDIFPDRVVIVETNTDFTGAQQSKTYELGIGVRGAKSKK